MTDLTPTFNSLLTQHLTTPPKLAKAHLPTTPFLAEAHRTAELLSEISRHLASTHQPYLSLTSTTFTEADRNALDTTIQSLLRQALSLITRLQQTESVRASTAAAVRSKKRNTWRAILNAGLDAAVEQDPEEQAEKMLAAHHESVLWWLKERLAGCSETQRRRQEIRLQRKLEKGRSILAEQKAAGVGIRSASSTGSAPKKPVRKGRVNAGMDEEEDVEKQLGEEVVKMLEQENEGLLRYYEDALEQVKTVETSLLEISELQTQLVTQLSEQNTLIDSLMQDSMSTEENVSKGNKELKKAAEKTSIARSAFFASVIFSSVVVVWDLFI